MMPVIENILSTATEDALGVKKYFAIILKLGYAPQCRFQKSSGEICSSVVRTVKSHIVKSVHDVQLPQVISALR
jgi:hypothetical protein